MGLPASSHADKFILALGHFCDGSLPLTACSLMSCLWANVISEEKTSLTPSSQMAAPPLPFPPPCHLSLFSCIALSSPDIVIKYASLLCCQLHVSGPVHKLHDAKVQPCFVQCLALQSLAHNGRAVTLRELSDECSQPRGKDLFLICLHVTVTQGHPHRAVLPH